MGKELRNGWLGSSSVLVALSMYVSLEARCRFSLIQIKTSNVLRQVTEVTDKKNE